MILIKFTLKMDENYFSNFFQSISRLSRIPLLYFQKIKKMAYRSGSSQKNVTAKMFLIGPRNSY